MWELWTSSESNLSILVLDSEKAAWMLTVFATAIFPPTVSLMDKLKQFCRIRKHEDGILITLKIFSSNLYAGRNYPVFGVENKRQRQITLLLQKHLLSLPKYSRYI